MKNKGRIPLIRHKGVDYYEEDIIVVNGIPCIDPCSVKIPAKKITVNFETYEELLFGHRSHVSVYRIDLMPGDKVHVSYGQNVYQQLYVTKVLKNNLTSDIYDVYLERKQND